MGPFLCRNKFGIVNQFILADVNNHEGFGPLLTFKNKTMNKEELLKIFSAYLPYNLKLQHNYEKAKHNGETELRSWVKPLEPLDLGCLFPHRKDSFDWKPILYDLSYLTKEIEHEGKRFIPLIELAKINAPQRRFKINGSLVVDNYGYHFFYNQNSFIWVHGLKAHTVINQRQLFGKLYEWHLNVFQLPKDQFINKATLNRGFCFKNIS